jgi:hypothetical protein
MALSGMFWTLPHLHRVASSSDTPSGPLAALRYCKLSYLPALRARDRVVVGLEDQKVLKTAVVTNKPTEV